MKKDENKRKRGRIWPMFLKTIDFGRIRTQIVRVERDHFHHGPNSSVRLIKLPFEFKASVGGRNSTMESSPAAPGSHPMHTINDFYYN